MVSVLIAAGIGVPAGLLAGFAGGWIDAVLSRIVDAMLACPFLILAIALAAFLGPDLTNAMIAIGVSTAPRFMRVARAATLDASSNDYVEAARAIGNPAWRVAVRHVLPNIVPPVLVQGTLAIAAAIIAEASLSFLGLGQQPPAPSWGSMLNSAQRFLSQAPWLAVFPGPCDLPGRAVVQPGRRRAARRARPQGTMMRDDDPESAIIGFIDYCHCQIRSNVTRRGRLPPVPVLCHALRAMGAERAQWRNPRFALAPL